MQNSLRKMNKTVCLRVHPEIDNWFGRAARAYLYSEGKSAHFASAIFYMMDVIRSVLLYSWRREDFVIFVRYLMGTAYLPSPLHMLAYNFFSAVLPKSEKMFFLDVNPKEAAMRIVNNRKETEMFESFEALEKVRTKVLALTRFDKWVIIDSNKTIVEVALDLKMNLNLENN